MLRETLSNPPSIDPQQLLSRRSRGRVVLYSEVSLLRRVARYRNPGLVSVVRDRSLALVLYHEDGSLEISCRSWRKLASV